MHISFTGAGRDALDAALSRASQTAPHWRPLLRAVRFEACGLVMVAQSLRPFSVPADPPPILLVGDDLTTALGPGRFDRDSMVGFLAGCGAVTIVASAPVVPLYAETARWAVKRRQPVAIIETRPDREAEWLDLVRAVAPADVALALATTCQDAWP